MINVGDRSKQSLDNLINTIGRFTFLLNGKKRFFNGVVKFDDERIIIQCEVPVAVLPDLQGRYSVIGRIKNVPVSFYQAREKRCWKQTRTSKKTKALVDFTFSYAVIGYGKIEEMRVAKIHLYSSELNAFFPLVRSSELREEDILKSLVELKANDEFEKVVIGQTLAYQYSRKGSTTHIYTYISCSFDVPLEIPAAVARVASIRNLLTFFCCRYIGLVNLTVTDPSHSRGIRNYREYVLIYNYNEHPDEHIDRFFISGMMIEKTFSQVINEWCKFETKAHPITALFYGIVSGNTTWINDYLNIAQAIEVYSARFRRSVIRQALGISKKERITLKHRIEDLLTLYSHFYSISDISALSQKLSDARNFYTHYDKDKKEPTDEELYCSIQILRSILLLVIYKCIGLSDETIAQARLFGFMKSFNGYCEFLLGEETEKS